MQRILAIIKIVKAGKTKASLKAALNYISNEEKITNKDGKKLISAINCWGDLKNIYQTMITTKQLYRKSTDNKHSEMYKHFQQSFKPQEIKPNIAHEIGLKWAKQNFGDDGFEICICTHLDTEHIHNHFIINSVNALTGKTIEIHANRTLEQLKYSSDELCKQYNLSVIDRTLDSVNQRIYSMRKKYSLEREVFKNLTWQKEIYDKIIKVLNLSSGKSFSFLKQELFKQGIEIKYERLKNDLNFHLVNRQRSISDNILAETFNDKSILRYNIERIIGSFPEYNIEKNLYLSPKKQGFYDLIENLLKAIDTVRKSKIKTKLEFCIFMEKQGWVIKDTQTGRAFYNKQYNRYIYDNMIFKFTKEKRYCLKDIELKLK